MTVLTFAMSIVVAVAVAYRVSRHMTRGLGALQLSTALIGVGKLDHRIAIETRDELGNLAQAFNDMTDNLLSARTELTQANQELERRHHELEKQRQVSDSLLLNILPVQVAQELEAKGAVEPKYYEDVTILLTDFVGFPCPRKNWRLRTWFICFTITSQRLAATSTSISRCLT